MLWDVRDGRPLESARCRWQSPARFRERGFTLSSLSFYEPVDVAVTVCVDDASVADGTLDVDVPTVSPVLVEGLDVDEVDVVTAEEAVLVAMM